MTKPPDGRPPKLKKRDLQAAARATLKNMKFKPTYEPDRWVLVRFASAEKPKTYRVHAGWASSYLTGPEWRASSPIHSITVTEDQFVIRGDSGSTYYCRKSLYGTTVLSAGTLQGLIDMGRKTGVTVTPIPIDELDSVIESISTTA